MLSSPLDTTTKGAHQLDGKDNRSRPFLHLMSLLRQMESRPRWIVLENVKGFLHSDVLRWGNVSIIVSLITGLFFIFRSYPMTDWNFDVKQSSVSWVHLTWITYSGVELDWVELSWVDLTWVNFTWADMSRVEFDWAQLSWAALTRVEILSSGVCVTEQIVMPQCYFVSALSAESSCEIGTFIF